MAVETHVAELGLFQVNPISGRVYQRGSDNLTIKEALTFNTEHRLVSNSNNSHTADNPSIETYLDREAADDFVPVSVTQSMVITTKTT
jgi:hypothetical protein